MLTCFYQLSIRVAAESEALSVTAHARFMPPMSNALPLFVRVIDNSFYLLQLAKM